MMALFDCVQKHQDLVCLFSQTSGVWGLFCWQSVLVLFQMQAQC